MGTLDFGIGTSRHLAQDDPEPHGCPMGLNVSQIDASKTNTQIFVSVWHTHVARKLFTDLPKIVADVKMLADSFVALIQGSSVAFGGSGQFFFSLRAREREQ